MDIAYNVLYPIDDFVHLIGKKMNILSIKRCNERGIELIDDCMSSVVGVVFDDVRLSDEVFEGSSIESSGKFTEETAHFLDITLHFSE